MAWTIDDIMGCLNTTLCRRINCYMLLRDALAKELWMKKVVIFNKKKRSSYFTTRLWKFTISRQYRRESSNRNFKFWKYNWNRIRKSIFLITISWNFNNKQNKKKELQILIEKSKQWTFRLFNTTKNYSFRNLLYIYRSIQMEL